MATGAAGAHQIVQGNFGETWLEVAAAGAGILHGRPYTVDLDKADVQLTLPGMIGHTYCPTVKAQVKCTTGARLAGDHHLLYELDVTTYDVLRRRDHSVPRVLVVFAVPDQEPRYETRPDGMLLRGTGVWLSLEGAPATTNRSSVTVRLPRCNAVNDIGLKDLLTRHGVRRSTPVPVVDSWEDE